LGPTSGLVEPLIFAVELDSVPVSQSTISTPSVSATHIYTSSLYVDGSIASLVLPLRMTPPYCPHNCPTRSGWAPHRQRCNFGKRGSCSGFELHGGQSARNHPEALALPNASCDCRFSGCPIPCPSRVGCGPNASCDCRFSSRPIPCPSLFGFCCGVPSLNSFGTDRPPRFQAVGHAACRHRLHLA
jgi:hypothetical protein